MDFNCNYVSIKDKKKLLLYSNNPMNCMRRILLTFVCFLAFGFVSAQGDLTHEVAANTERWPVPQTDSSWKLEYLPHNNANHNVYVYKDKLYDGLFNQADNCTHLLQTDVELRCDFFHNFHFVNRKCVDCFLSKFHSGSNCREIRLSGQARQ